MIVARRYLVRGLVHGVGFRFFTDEVARREGLSGFVRNCDDGSVETLVEGEREAVDRFERSINQGPPLSRVDDVSVASESPTGTHTGFVIRK